jgi:hypothetical protein
MSNVRRLTSSPIMFTSIYSLLASRQSRSYIALHYSFRWLVTETEHEGRRFQDQLAADRSRYASFREQLAETLTKEHDEQAKQPVYWVHFLKSRIERLDFWSNTIGSLGTFLAGIAAINALVIGRFVASTSFAFSLVGLIVGVGALLFRASIDRQRYWYKYVSSQLEAVKCETEAAPNPSIEGTASGLRPPAAPHVKR